MSGTDDAELERIRAVYAARATTPADRFARFMVRERTPLWLARLDAAPGTRATRRVLEIGCGGGGNLALLIEHGYDPAHLVGNELLDDRVAAARRTLPDAVRIVPGDATTAVFPGESYDAVVQSTVFTSILDAEVRARLAARMWSLVAPGGGVLWYDFTVDNPRNPDVRGVPVAEVRALFPDADPARSRFDRVTLAPPLGRLCARLGERAGAVAWKTLATMPFLRTHVVGWLAKA